MRAQRYLALVQADDSPIDVTVLPFEELLVEPVYQLMRTQLLAHALEQDPDLNIDRARVIYAAPACNTALWNSLPRPSLRAAAKGMGLLGLWRRVLRDPQSFAYLDTTTLVRPTAPTSRAFQDRYRHMDTGANVCDAATDRPH